MLRWAGGSPSGAPRTLSGSGFSEAQLSVLEHRFDLLASGAWEPARNALDGRALCPIQNVEGYR